MNFKNLISLSPLRESRRRWLVIAYFACFCGLGWFALTHIELSRESVLSVFVGGACVLLLVKGGAVLRARSNLNYSVEALMGVVLQGMPEGSELIVLEPNSHIFYSDGAKCMLGLNKIGPKAGLRDILQESNFKEFSELDENLLSFERGGTDSIKCTVSVNSEQGKVRSIQLEIRRVSISKHQAPYVTLSLLDQTAMREVQDTFSEKEEKLRFVFDSSPVGLLWFIERNDPIKGRVTGRIFNRAHQRISGLNDEEMERVDIFQKITHPDDLKKQAPYREKMNNREISEYSMEKRFIQKDGKVNWVRATWYRMWDEDGDGFQELCSLVDITELKKTAEDLKRTEVRLRFIFESAPMGLRWISKREDPVAGDVVEEMCNPAHQKISGLRNADLNTPGIFDRITHPDDLAEQTRLRAKMENGEIDELSLDKRYILEGGKVSWVRLSWLRRWDEDGKGMQELSSLIDITPIKEASELVERKEAQLRFVFESAPIGLYWKSERKNASGNLIKDRFYNPSHLAITGVDESEIDIKEIFANRSHPDEIEEQKRMREKLMRREINEFSLEKRYIHKNGRIVWVKATWLRKWDADLEGHQEVCTLVDITEQKKNATMLRRSMKSAEAANEAKSLFLAMMSHEIRTPMNGIIGMTSLLLGTKLNDDQVEYATTIRSSSDSLLTIINEILDFSKIESGKMELEETAFDLTECLTEALDLMVASAFNKKVDLIYDLQGDIPDKVIGDPTRLRQILVNLLSNALKFTNEGDVTLKVCSTQLPNGKVVLEFSIKDSGVGIASDRISRIFDSFSQADSTTTRKYGGTGLGLSISKRLAELMGGRMWAVSEEGKGSTFCFTAVVEPCTDRKSKSIWEESRCKFEGKRVLIVDDNKRYCKILSNLLERAGIESKYVRTSDEAIIELDKDTSYDSAILDMQMPEINGVQLARSLKASTSKKAIPLIIHSSIGERLSDEDKTLFASTLNKPATPKQLLSTLTKVFERKVEKALPDRVAILHSELRVLLVEDHLINQKVALRILSSLGYKADLAANGLEALEALERQTYDMIFMDMQMPEMDGLTATQKIVERLPNELERPWIIALTANAILGDRERCVEAGMDAYLSKPIRTGELEREILKGIESMKESGRCQQGSRLNWRCSFPPSKTI